MFLFLARPRFHGVALRIRADARGLGKPRSYSIFQPLNNQPTYRVIACKPYYATRFSTKMKTITCLITLTLTVAAFEPDIIIDANNPVAPASVTLTGAWVNAVSPNLVNAFRGDSKMVNSSSTATHAVFKTRLPKAGPYSVFVWHNGGTFDFVGEPAGQVAVTHADATPYSANMSQTTNAGQWLLVATFWFEGNDDGLNTCKEAEVKVLSIASAGKFSADAVRFMAATADMVVDSDTAGATVAFAPSAANWPSTTDKAGNFGNLRRASSATATAMATHTFTVPTSGDHDVSIWVPGNTGAWLSGGLTAATTFNVEIQHPTLANQIPPASTTVTVTLPTSGTNEGQWVRLINPATLSAPAPRTGTFRFKPSIANLFNRVIIKTAGATGAGAGPWQVPADAVRLTKVGDWATYMDEDDSPFPPVPGVAGTTNWSTTVQMPKQARIWSQWEKVPFGAAWKSFYYSSNSQGPASMSYSPLIMESGLFDLYLWYPKHEAYYNNPLTKLTVQTALGTVTGAVNQLSGMGMWRFSGRYILNPSDFADPNLRPKVTISTPVNPYTPGTYPYYNFSYSSTGLVASDGMMFLRDVENIDTDGEGLFDWQEGILGTSINLSDTDGDSVDDYIETLQGRNPNAGVVSNPEAFVDLSLFLNFNH